MDDIIARIKHKLAYLQQHDDGDVTDATYERKWPVEHHYPYEVDLTHTDKQLTTFEAKHRIRLPEDYRQFLMQVGSRGYNPGYAMYSPLEDVLTIEEERDFTARFNSDEEIDEDELWKEDAPFIGDLAQPFPFKTAMTYEDIERFCEENGLSFNDIEWLGYGHLTVGFAGCQCWYLLIITGEARGQIWYMDGLLFTPVMLLDGELFDAVDHPVKATQAQHVTFAQWYEAWLNRQIRVAQEHWQKRGRVVPPLHLDPIE
jgi:hypothetical protein